MMNILAEFPRLGSAILWAVSRDEAMIVEHPVSIGRRSAIERTAHFFLELYERLLLVGLAKNATFDCPLTQYVLADALGLSAIHVNRTLRQLRELKLMTLRDRHVVVNDVNGLKKLAGYGHPLCNVSARLSTAMNFPRTNLDQQHPCVKVLDIRVS